MAFTTDKAPVVLAESTTGVPPGRTIFVGIGGASCSGKTSLATHLLRILPTGSFIVHQVCPCPLIAYPHARYLTARLHPASRTISLLQTVQFPSIHCLGSRIGMTQTAQSTGSAFALRYKICACRGGCRLITSRMTISSSRTPSPSMKMCERGLNAERDLYLL